MATLYWFSKLSFFGRLNAPQIAKFLWRTEKKSILKSKNKKTVYLIQFYYNTP